MTGLEEADRIALNALADGELDAGAAEALRARLAEDPALGAEYETILATRAAVSGLPRPAVSDELLAHIMAGQGMADRAPGGGVRWWAGWRSLAASIVITALLASGTTYFLMAQMADSSIAALVASGHHRSLLAASPVDVASADRHTVKPWLDARLGVSPPAPDLAAQGYVLLGGRVEMLGQQPVPALVYRHNEHLITLVAVPDGTMASAPQAVAELGYNMVRWSGDGFSYWAISDLEADELAAFAADFRAAAG